jgi:CRISPR-associated protein Cas1
MNKNYYLFSSGELKREDDSLRLDIIQEGSTDDFKRIPANKVDALYCFGQIRYNTRLLDFLNKKTIELHVFGWNDQYTGSHIPTANVKSGNTILKQAAAHQTEERVKIAREIIVGSIHNMVQNLKYYNNKECDFSPEISELTEIKTGLPRNTQIDLLMGHEARARKKYYDCFGSIISSSEFKFKSRKYNPPSSKINSLISFLNTMVYTNVTSAIRQTALEPTIGFLHTPGERRNSLALDIADVFKPILADRCLFRIINRNQIKPTDFEENYTLSEDSKKNVISEMENLMSNTIKHPDLNRNVSYKYLLRLEAHKIRKHVTMNTEYEAYKRDW